MNKHFEDQTEFAQNVCVSTALAIYIPVIIYFAQGAAITDWGCWDLLGVVFAGAYYGLWFVMPAIFVGEYIAENWRFDSKITLALCGMVGGILWFAVACGAAWLFWEVMTSSGGSGGPEGRPRRGLGRYSY